MQETQQFHMGTRGYADIAYSYVIMPSGRVYVGRGFGVKGAHTLDHNSDVGICFAGTYTQRIPSDEAVAAFWQLKRHLRRRGVRGLGAVPHRATFSTACPGAKVVKALGL
jgi:N-acetylmuramoyl-L-alanine amidase